MPSSSSSPNQTTSITRNQATTRTMTPEQLEAAVDAISILNNITDSTTTEILDALSGTVFSEEEVSEIRRVLDEAEEA
jgi:threonine aldolase